MDAVKSFNEELSGIYESKPPISRAKMTMLTKKAIKGIKFYKHIVQSMEKFIQKCRPEYKVPGLYVVDSVVRQSRHQFGPEKDVFMPRLCKNIIATFQHIYKCPEEDKPRILRVLNLWQKNNVFPPDVVQQLMVMAGAPTPDAAVESKPSSSLEKSEQADGPNLTNLLANLLANPDAGQINNLAGLLSNSQQNQLQGLLKQVKGEEWKLLDIVGGEVAASSDSQDKLPQSLSDGIAGVKRESPKVFHPSDHPRQPPFLHSGGQAANRNQPPSFNRAVLDFDYSDDEQTPPNTHKQPPLNNLPAYNEAPPDIKTSLLSKLPTSDQIHKLTGVPPDSFDRRKLEAEQEIFDKQIQQLSSNNPDRKQGDSANKKRSRSRSRSRDRHRHRRSNHRSRSRERGHRSRRSRSRDKSRKSRRSRSQERRKEKNGLPPLKEGCVSVCTTTLWIGNISARVLQHELQNLVEEFGAVESLNMIPPRGCAYVCMKNRLEAAKALHKIRHHRLGGKSLKCDWAPSKGMPEKEKATWVKEHGVNYVPLTDQPLQVRQLSSWGFIDEESLPPDKRGELQSIVGEVPQPGVPPMQNQPAPVRTMLGGPMQFGAPNMAPMMAPNVTMAPRPQMMIRPGFQVQGISPFGAMGFRPQQIPPSLTPDKPKEGNSTPTNDEHSDENRPRMGIPHSPFQPQPQFGAMPQRYGGPMPMQIRMMPQQMMAPPPRVGVMPLRMGLPMQLRHGFHPQLQARMPMSGPPHMIASSMPSTLPMHQLQQPPQQHPIRSPAQLGGFPIRMQRFPPPSVGEPPISEAERVNDGKPRGVERMLSHSPTRQNDPNRPISNERRGSVDQPPSEQDKPHPDMREPPPGRFNDRPSNRGFSDRPPPRGGGRNGGSPPRGGGDGFEGRGFNRDRPRDFDRRPPDFERPRGRRDFDRPSRFDRDRDGDRGRDRDGDRRRDGERRKERSRSRDRNRDRDRRDDRRERGPPGRFGGRFDNDRRGGFNGGAFRGRGGGRGGGFNRDRSPEIDPEEEEYNRKRKETLRKRHEEEDQYVMEESDLGQFGLPVGFGGPMLFSGEVSAEAQEKEKGEEDERKKRRRWLDDQRSSRRSRDRSPRRDRDRDRRERSPKSVTSPKQESRETSDTHEDSKETADKDLPNQEEGKCEAMDTNENQPTEPSAEHKECEPTEDVTDNSPHKTEEASSNQDASESGYEDIPKEPPISPDNLPLDPPDSNDDTVEPDSHPEVEPDSNRDQLQPHAEQAPLDHTDVPAEPAPICMIEKVEPNSNLDTIANIETDKTMQYSTASPGTPTYDEPLKSDLQQDDFSAEQECKVEVDSEREESNNDLIEPEAE